MGFQIHLQNQQLPIQVGSISCWLHQRKFANAAETSQGRCLGWMLATGTASPLGAIYTSSGSNDTGANGEFLRDTGRCPGRLFAAVLVIRCQMDFDTQGVEGLNSVKQAMAKAAVALKHPLHSDRPKGHTCVPTAPALH